MGLAHVDYYYRVEKQQGPSVQQSEETIQYLVINQNGNEHIETGMWRFPGDVVGKNLPADAGDRNSVPGLGRFHKAQSN